MAKAKTIRRLTVRLLSKEGPKTTTEIYEYINESSRWGCTMNSLGNVLTRCPEISKHGFHAVGRGDGDFSDAGCRNIIWGLTE